MRLLEMVVTHEEEIINEQLSSERKVVYNFINEAETLTEDEAAFLISEVKGFWAKDWGKTKQDFNKMKAAIKADYEQTVKDAKGSVDKIAKAKKAYRRDMDAADKWLKSKSKGLWKKANTDYSIVIQKTKKA
jgi:uncharacterized C2H2 Zn-finger protein